MNTKSDGVIKHTIYFDSSKNLWRANVTYQQDGNKQRKVISSKDKEELPLKIEEFDDLITKDSHQRKEKGPLFQNYADKWLENIQKIKLKPSTYDVKYRTYKNYVRPNLGKKRIENITYDDVQSLIVMLNNMNYSYSIIKKAFDFVNECLRNYRVANRLSYNPCEGIELPKKKEKDISEHRFFSADERKLIENEASRKYANGTPVYEHGDIILFLMYSGLRYAEFAALTWKDIDFEEKTISITKSSVYTCVDGKNQFVNQTNTKTKSGMRIIPLTKKAEKALINMKKKNGSQSDYLITTKRQKQITPGNLNKTLHRILHNANILEESKSCGVHTLRHTFATMLFENGCQTKVVSELLGHSSTKITENIYIHIIQKQKVKAIDGIDKFCS